MDDFILPLPPSWKKPWLTIFQRCIICQSDLPDNPLRTGKKSSVSNLIQAAKSRQDGVFARLCQDGTESFSDKETLWHSSCYSTYTSAHVRHASSPNAAYAENAITPEVSAIEEKTKQVPRSERSLTD